MAFKVICLILLVHFVNNVFCQNDNKNVNTGMSFIGLALEAFNPCPDGFIAMEREIGRRPSEENYWKGHVNLDQYKNIPEARIELLLDNPAVMKIDEEIARVYSTGKLFRIFPFDPKDHISFEVKAPRGKPFPNIVSAKLNGKNVCINPKKFVPTILGAEPVALGSITPAPNDFVPYCGRPQIEHNELVVNGSPTKRGDWPWHVALYSYNNEKTVRTYRCGGTLISLNAVLTAAHCVTSNGEVLASDLLLAIMGKYSLTKNDQNTQERQIKSIYVYDTYSASTLRNDIAIFQLATNVKFDQYIQPICLWPEDDIAKENIFGKTGAIVGWGLNENQSLSDELRTANLTIASDTECLLSYASFFGRYVYENSLCAGNTVNGTNACNGDSGGGLVMPIMQVDNKVSYFLRGVVSVSVSQKNQAICDPKHYVIYTDTAQYLYWINKYK